PQRSVKETTGTKRTRRGKRPTPSSPARPRTLLGDVDLEVLDDRVGQERLGETAYIGELGLVHFALDLDLETLSLTHLIDPLKTQAGAGLGDRPTLWVQDLGLEHDVHYDAGHSVLQRKSTGVRTARRPRRGLPRSRSERATPAYGTHGPVEHVRAPPAKGTCRVLPYDCPHKKPCGGVRDRNHGYWSHHWERVVASTWVEDRPWSS